MAIFSYPVEDKIKPNGNVGNIGGDIVNDGVVGGYTASPTPPVHKFSSVQKGSDFFDASNVSKTGQEFDIKTGIESDSPEVILLTDFTPPYADNGQLNDFGKTLQLKQDSMLASAQVSIDSIVNSSAFDNVKTQVDKNRQDINDFCSQIINKSFSMLDKIEKIRRRFNFRNKFDDSVISTMGLTQIDPGYPKTYDDILYDYSKSPLFWCSTKVWVQSCLELKHVIRDGHVPSFLTDAVFPQLPQAGTKELEDYNSSYNFFAPISSNIKRFAFSENQISDFPDFSGLVLDKKSIGNYIDQIKVLFENGNLSSNLFNSPLKSDSESDDFSLTKVSYLLCKEMIFSKMIYELSVKSSTLKDRYGFVRSNTSNINVWDYIIGQAGSDVTDISNSPLGSGNSLISLAQFKEGDFSILSFENFFINDNIGKNSNSTVLTPGSYYFLESSINVDANNGFDTSRLKSYINKLKISNNTITMLNSTVTDAFQSTTPVSYKNEFFSGVLDVTNKNLWSNSPKSSLLNPIDLHRSIVEKVFYGSDLAVKKLWTKNPASSPSGGSGVAQDVSPILISAAMEDVDLKCLLFMFVLGRVYGNSTSQYADVIADVIESLFKSKLVDTTLQGSSIPGQVQSQVGVFGNNSGVGILQNNQYSLSEGSANSYYLQKGDIKSALIEGDVSRKKILCNIADFIKQILDLDSYAGSFKLDAATNKPTSTWYSSVHIISIFSMIFNICCMVIHSANPERFTKQYGDFFLIDSVDEIENSLYSLASTLDSSDKTFYDYSQLYESYLNSFSVFLKTLEKEMQEFSDSLESKSFQDLLSLINSTIEDPPLTRLLMNPEQIKLVQNKLLDLSSRTNQGYSSPLKNVVPYFSSYKDNSDVDVFLPIEEIHTYSWELLLKNYLNISKLRGINGFNTKIISVGIPQKIRRKLLEMNASDISNGFDVGILTIQLWRRDNLRPFLFHRSKDFTFNMNLFPTKILDSYAEYSQNQSWVYNLANMIPLMYLSSKGSSIVKRLQEFKNHPEISYLPEKTKEDIYKNHVDSFMAEEYLRFVGSANFDEHSFSKYDEISKNSINQQYANFVKKNLNNVSLNSSSTTFYNSNSLVVEDTSRIKKDILKPKKFDRVFHIIFDPDDFMIDEVNTTQQTIDQYLKKKYPDIVKLGNGYQRRQTFSNEFTFDDYYVTLTTASA
jgi:hypothetical protein